MSRDKSLRSASSLTRHRNVLTRAERIDMLKDTEKWVDGTDPYGLPKIGHRKVSVGGKTKKEKTTETDEAAPAATETPEAEKK